MTGNHGYGEVASKPPSMATDRLFFAAFPDHRAAIQIAQLARHLRGEHGLKGMPLATERFHVTLHHLGDYVGLPQYVITQACGAAATVTMPPFETRFDQVLSFGAKRRKYPLVLRGGEGVSELAVLRKVLGSAMEDAGFSVSGVKSNYTPHVTLLYDTQRVVQQAVETVAWTVREFVLVHSLLGQTRHIALMRWSLSA